MVKLYNNFNIRKNHKGSIILIGNFDGVHKGHQKLFRLAKTYKKKYNSKIGVINFDPFPKMFFNKSLKNFIYQINFFILGLIEILIYSMTLKIINLKI